MMWYTQDGTQYQAEPTQKFKNRLIWKIANLDTKQNLATWILSELHENKSDFQTEVMTSNFVNKPPPLELSQKENICRPTRGLQRIMRINSLAGGIEVNDIEDRAHILLELITTGATYSTALSGDQRHRHTLQQSPIIFVKLLEDRNTVYKHKHAFATSVNNPKRNLLLLLSFELHSSSPVAIQQFPSNTAIPSHLLFS